MISIKDKIRIERLKSKFVKHDLRFRTTLYAFNIYPKTPLRHPFYRYSLSDLSTLELLRHLYLGSFFRDLWFSVLNDNDNRKRTLKNAAMEITISDQSRHPEEDFLLQLYRIYLVSIILERFTDQDTYQMFDDKSIDELEEFYDRQQEKAELEQEQSAAPFWKFW